MPTIRLLRASLLTPFVTFAVLAAVGLTASGCESDDTSPVTPVVDAGSDHASASDAAASDAPAASEAASEAAPASEASTSDAPSDVAASDAHPD
jgi:hypothetical protein